MTGDHCPPAILPFTHSGMLGVIQFEIMSPALLMTGLLRLPGSDKIWFPNLRKLGATQPSTHVCVCMNKHVYVHITLAFTTEILMLI